MIYIEVALISILLSICIYATMTDLKYGIITNKSLLYASIPCIALNALYYSLFAQDYFRSFILNLVIMSMIAVLFYAYHIWAAGDSKLLIMMIFALPARLFYVSQQSLAPTISIIILVFSFAFIYLVAESIVIGIKQKDLLELKFIRINIVSFLKQYAMCILYITLVNEIWLIDYFSGFYQDNIILVMVVNLFIIITVLYAKILSNRYILLFSCLTTITVGFITQFNFWGMFHIETYLVAILIVLLRIIAEKYNYQTIPTQDVKKGMVLSWATVLLFAPSRVKGLPSNTTEDIRSRITQKEVESILRWKDSKLGTSEVTIVRKMPFAIFITIGTIAFIIMRVLYGY